MRKAYASESRHLIFVVEDHDALRDALKFLLGIEGFLVEVFDRGEMLLERDLPDRDACLVLDEHLPGISGAETLRRLRARRVELPAILVTTHPKPELQRTAANERAIILEKPLLGDALVAHIRALLGV